LSAFEPGVFTRETGARPSDGCATCLESGLIVVKRPAEYSAFEFAVLAGLRAAQLTRGCTPRTGSDHKIAVTAQMEVAEHKVEREALVVSDAVVESE
jgi:DNA-directed RNA polymerase subunit K/omega